jgi:hypothetical protein
MEIIGNYEGVGHALIKELITPDLAKAFLATLQSDLGPGDLPVSQISHVPNLLKRPTFEMLGPPLSSDAVLPVGAHTLDARDHRPRPAAELRLLQTTLSRRGHLPSSP